MKRLSLVLMALLVAFVVSSPVQGAGARQLDSMDNIAARPWTDYRSPGEGTGMMLQNNTTYYEGTGSMEIDYGVTNDSAGTPNPLSGWDYQGNWLGVGVKAAAFGDPCLGGNWYGHYDREIGGAFVPAEWGGGPLDTTCLITLDVYNAFQGDPGHVRELQLYDNVAGLRNCYQVQSEAGAGFAPAGWNHYVVDLGSPLSSAANLGTIDEIRLFVTCWSSWFDGTDWQHVSETGLPVLIDNLRLIPEPATIALLSLGGLALLRRRKA